uniref:Uncharacterized protein n=1 Tax=Romanomermis culicivorax TaxID=13658 RepID=A0A915KJ21_ROMCU
MGQISIKQPEFVDILVVKDAHCVINFWQKRGIFTCLDSTQPGNNVEKVIAQDQGDQRICHTPKSMLPAPRKNHV